MATQGIFIELATLAAIPAAAYAVGEEVDGALCLIETPPGTRYSAPRAGPGTKYGDSRTKSPPISTFLACSPLKRSAPGCWSRTGKPQYRLIRGRRNESGRPVTPSPVWAKAAAFCPQPADSRHETVQAAHREFPVIHGLATWILRRQAITVNLPVRHTGRATGNEFGRHSRERSQGTGYATLSCALRRWPGHRDRQRAVHRRRRRQDVLAERRRALPDSCRGGDGIRRAARAAVGAAAEPGGFGRGRQRAARPGQRCGQRAARPGQRAAC